ncbi:NXPE family member 3-like isoform X1 [Xiphophorus maculatus]|uniref:Neurexophilin and PC-esterase domain family member 3 n=2 Tax=Xiphophorus maculatus TaxID=8083 RepID=A0A3B5Q9J2_XIPMA|nr:NXPE family member 3-like isoform X1 [Xiphophorus maculatus]
MQKNTKSQIESSLLLGGQALRKRFPLKYGWLFLLLAFVVLWVMFSNPNVADHITGKLAQLKNKVPTTEALIPTTRTLKRPTEPPKPTSFCSFHSVLPEDALELEFLKNYITWPETPSVPANFCLNDTSHPAHSTFTILPRDGGGSWHVGDQLEVLIKINDFLGRPKKSGGDVLFARLHNRTVQAGVVGKVFDHRNGSYTAVFSLLWEGSAQVEVTLVHSSEAVTVLERVNLEKPGRIFFQSLFRSGSVTEDTNCNVCLKAPPEQLCNFTDTHTGEPWFCYKPKTLKCEHRVSHAFKGFVPHPTGNEAKLFQSGVNLKVSIPSSGSSNITILPKLKVPNETVPVNMSEAMRGAGPVGYYYQGVWRALDGTTVHQFNNATAISQCLKGKVLHLYGDSTVRQWFEFLIAKAPDLKKFDLKTPPKTGPFMALDYKNNILLTFRCHGPPLRAPLLPVSQFHFVANELDSVVGGTNTVVIFGVWAHFGVYPVEVYIRRLLSIRRAVVRLLTRAPGTLVIIRTGNPKKLTLRESLTTDDYYALQRDKILRAIFKEVNVRLLDAWEMTQAHYLPHDLHPPQPIIKNMIDVILSHICSQR